MKSTLSCRRTHWPFGFIPLVAIIAIVGLSRTGLRSSPSSEAKPGRTPEPDVIEVSGRTQCVPGRKAVIAPAGPPHPVTEVFVALGDRVKKGQRLVKIDDDEPQANLRAKQANLRSAEAVLDEAKCHLEAIAKGHEKGAVSQEHYHDVRTTAIKAEMDAQAAKAALEEAKAELEHFIVEAKIDGVVNWLDVYRGTVSRPGTAVWGEILDLSEMDVRCDLAPDQVDQFAVGQNAEVRTSGKRSFSAKGQVVFIGRSADLSTGLVPVVIRLPNPGSRLRCGVSVRVRFAQSSR
jgi:RND family efflux transporter MFP subunit